MKSVGLTQLKARLSEYLRLVRTGGCNVMKRGWIGAALVALVLVRMASGFAAEPGLLVDTAWLGAHLNDANIRIVDMVSEPQTYRTAHVPGAVYLNVDDARVGVPAGGFRLPTEEEAARLLGGLGIAPDTHVVIYDDAGGLHAARLFFTLDVFGHAKASLLDGGIQAWQRAKLPLTTEIPKIVRTDYRPKLRRALVAGAEWVRDRLNDPAIALVDARTPAEYAGRDVRARRGGHIPGAVNIEWRQNLRADGTFKPLDDLRRMYAAHAVTPDRTVVTYCQTHHRAAHTYFVLRLLGYPRIAGYDRSWIEWGNRDDLPIAQ